MNRRTFAAGCLVLAPLLVSASHFFWPAGSEGSDSEQIHAAALHPAAWTTATVVETAGWLLFVPGLLALWSLATGRGRVLTGTGVWLSVLGMAGYYGAGVMNLVTIGMGRRHDDATMAALMHALKHDPAMFWFLVAPLLLGTLSLFVAFLGFARAGLVGWWAPAAVLVGIVASQLLSESDDALLLAAAFTPITAACVGAARRLGLAAEPADPAPTPSYAVA
jgi:hypothetical protein